MRAKEFISEVGAGTKQQFKAGDSNAEIPRMAAGMGKDNSYDSDKYIPADSARVDKNSGMVSIKTGDNERDIYAQRDGVARVGSASGTKDINMNTGQTLRSQSQDLRGTTVGKDHVAGTTTIYTNLGGTGKDHVAGTTGSNTNMGGNYPDLSNMGGKGQERTTKDGSGQELKNREVWDFGLKSLEKNREGGKENSNLWIPNGTDTGLKVDATPVSKGRKVDVLQRDGSYRQAHLDDLGVQPSIVSNPNDVDQRQMMRTANEPGSFGSQANSYGARGEIAPGTAMTDNWATKKANAQRRNKGKFTI